MSVARNTEITATSAQSFEDAIQEGITRATQTLRNVTGAWVKEQEVRVDGNQIVEYKVTMIVTFILE
jgi:dodecin